MSDKCSDFFDNTIGVKQGCTLSQTLFGLCIDELEEMVTKFAKEEVVEEVAIENDVIMLLLYAFCKYFRRCAKAYAGTGKNLHAYEIKC